jgi:hypothetical protein
MAAFQQAAKLQEEAGRLLGIETYFFLFKKANLNEIFVSQKLLKQKNYLQEPKIV